MQRVCWEVCQQGVGNPLAVIQKYQIFHNGPIFDFLYRDEVDTRGRYSGDVREPSAFGFGLVPECIRWS